MLATLVRGRRRMARLLPLLGTALFVASTGSALAAGGWDTTLTHALADSTRAASMTPVADDMPMQITLALKVRDRAAMDAMIKAQNTPGNPQYQKFLTPQQFAAQFAPSPEQTQAVADYLRNSGFGNVRISASGLLVGGVATAAQVRRAFNTDIRLSGTKDQKGRPVYLNTLDAQVPASLGGVVLHVGGLQNSIRMQTGMRRLPNGAAGKAAMAQPKANGAVRPDADCSPGPSCLPATGGTFTPVDFPLTYDAGSTSTASNTIIAISTYGDDLSADEGSTVIEDLRNAEDSFGLPYVPVEVRLATPIATADVDTSGDGEWDLDTQYSTGMAGNVKALVIYAADDSVVDNLLWEYAAFADAADAKVGNMSYGLCELFVDGNLPGGKIISIVDGGLPNMQASDQFFAQAVLEGLSWHASSGDSGGYCTVGNVEALPGTGVPAGANYPASSPYVVSVGGTSLLPTSNYQYITGGTGELAWLSGGGGISVLEPAPSWQTNVVASAQFSAEGFGRGVPDIAMFSFTDAVAIAIWGSELYSAGSADEAQEVVGGTSLSSPLAVGSWARFETSYCNTLGFAAPDYYGLASATLPYTATGFNDIIAGSNAFYVATPGWDYTTGFGSIDIANVLAGLNKEIPVPSSCAALPAAPAVSTVDTYTTTANASASIEVFPALGADPVAYYVIDFGDGVPGASGTGISSAFPDAPNPDVAVQPTVPWPNQMCAGSSNGAAPLPPPSSGGGSTSCMAPFTGNPAVFTHTYPKTGTYTAHAWVRNAHGVVSAQYNFTVTPGTLTAPIAPTALLAMAASSSSVTLAWTASAAGASDYYVYYGTTPGGETTKSAAITGTSTTITGLNGGTAYYFVVKAYNHGTALNSAASNEASATTPLAAPANLTATAGTGQVTLSWTGSPGASDYYAYSTPAGGATTKSAAIVGTSATLTGLSSGTVYSFVVKAYNHSSAITSPASNTASATPN
jgi:hypothetical protein